jgi:hypothetical protein
MINEHGGLVSRPDTLMLKNTKGDVVWDLFCRWDHGMQTREEATPHAA